MSSHLRRNPESHHPAATLPPLLAPLGGKGLGGMLMTSTFAQAPRLRQGDRLLALMLFLTALSQLPAIMDNALLRQGVPLAWGAIVVALFIVNPRVRLAQPLVMAGSLTLAVTGYTLLMSIVTATSYFSSPLLYLMYVDVGLLLAGYLVATQTTDDTQRIAASGYTVGTFVLAIAIYFTSLRGADWLTSPEYLYTSKNSVAAVLTSAIILALAFQVPHNRYLRIIIVGTCLVVVVMVKSRATIIGGFIALIFAVLTIPRSNPRRLLGLALLVAVIATIYWFPPLHESVVEQLLLNNRGSMTLDQVSSGRIGHLEIFRELFAESPWAGSGPTYIESFPLAALTTFGLIGAIPVFAFAMIPAIVVGKTRGLPRNARAIRIAVTMLWLLLIANGVFEELSPLGPGMKSAALWLFTGMLIGSSSSSSAQLAFSFRMDEVDHGRRTSQ